MGSKSLYSITYCNFLMSTFFRFENCIFCSLPKNYLKLMSKTKRKCSRYNLGTPRMCFPFNCFIEYLASPTQWELSYGNSAAPNASFLNITSVVGRIMDSQTCPCPNYLHLWIHYLTRQNKLCRYDKVSWDGENTLHHPDAPNLIPTVFIKERRQQESKEVDVKTEAEIRMTQGHELKKLGSL